MLNCEENQKLKCFSGAKEIKTDKKFKRKAAFQMWILTYKSLFIELLKTTSFKELNIFFCYI